MTVKIDFAFSGDHVAYWMGKISQSHFYITPGHQFAKEVKKGG